MRLIIRLKFSVLLRPIIFKVTQHTLLSFVWWTFDWCLPPANFDFGSLRGSLILPAATRYDLNTSIFWVPSLSSLGWHIIEIWKELFLFHLILHHFLLLVLLPFWRHHLPSVLPLNRWSITNWIIIHNHHLLFVSAPIPALGTPKPRATLSPPGSLKCLRGGKLLKWSDLGIALCFQKEVVEEEVDLCARVVAEGLWVDVEGLVWSYAAQVILWLGRRRGTLILYTLLT